MNGQAIAPGPESGIDVPAQIAQIEALLDTGQIDCLSIEPPGLERLHRRSPTDCWPRASRCSRSACTSNGNEFTNFTQIPREGRQARPPRSSSSGWPTTARTSRSSPSPAATRPPFWAQGRMKGFEETIKAAIPDATFVTDEANGLATTFDAGQTYDAYRAFLAGNPTVQFIENVDIGAEHADRAIEEAGKEGQGLHDRLEREPRPARCASTKGIQVAALDQQWSEQAGFGALACAELPEERRHPAEHPGAAAGHQGGRRPGPRGPATRSSTPRRRPTRRTRKGRATGPSGFPPRMERGTMRPASPQVTTER